MALATVVCAAALAAPSAGAVTITEYQVPGTPGAGPFGIASGPDGAMWATGTGALVRVTADGQVTSYPVEGGARSALAGIAAGSDGAIWFTDRYNGILLRSSTAGALTQTALSPPAPSQPDEITSGPDDALWITDWRGNQIYRSSVGFGLSSFPLPTASAYPEGIVAGPDGALWFGESNVGKIGRITTAGAVTEYSLPNAASHPDGITVGPDGALWFAETGTGKIGRITTDGTVEEYPLPSSSSAPEFITSGPDGALWFTETQANEIGRMTTDGSVTEYPVPTASSEPQGIAAGPDGALWFAETSGGKIGRLIPPSVQTTTSVSCSPTSVALYDETTCSATVSAPVGAAAPTGQVGFSDGGPNGSFSPSASCSLPGTSSDTCSVTYTPSAVSGTHRLSASYGGDSRSETSSGETDLPVGRRSTQTILSIPPVQYAGQRFGLIAIVAGGAGPEPTGRVRFTDEQVQLGEAVLDGGNPDRATLVVPSLAAGMHSFQAIYEGDGGGTFEGSSSPELEMPLHLLPQPPSVIPPPLTMVAVASGRAKVRQRTAPILLWCQAPIGSRCRGTLQLELRGKRPAARGRGRVAGGHVNSRQSAHNATPPTGIPTVDFDIGRGTSVVDVKLPTDVLQVIGSSHQLTVDARASVDGSTARVERWIVLVRR